MPFFLLVALLLFMADWLIMLVMQISSRFSGSLSRGRRRATVKPALKSFLATFLFISGMALFLLPHPPSRKATMRSAMPMIYTLPILPQTSHRKTGA